MNEFVMQETEEMTTFGSVWKRYEPVAELVRCKDCKYWSAERINDFNKCRRWINVGVKNFATMGDWFCADGERK